MPPARRFTPSLPRRGHGGGASRGIRDCSRRTRRKLVLGSKEGPGALLPKLPDHRLKPLPLYGGAVASHKIWARNSGFRPFSIPTFQKPPHGCDVQCMPRRSSERKKKTTRKKV